MKHCYSKLSVASVVFGLSASAAAEWRCDCTTIVDSCAAEVSIADEWVDITTDSGQCARVDYFIDGLPFVSVVVEGVQRQDWITRAENPDVLVQSCQVCRDNSENQSVPAASATRVPDAELEPLIEVEPVYPPTAQTQGLDGYVELSFSVTPFGIVQGAQITASEPEGVFDEVAIAAVNRWRYAQDSERAPQTVTTRFDFSVSDYIWQLPDNQGTAGTTMQDIPVGQWNQCVREDAVYNFGEMIEVRLMNACQQPLIVFGCAEGTGRYLGLWVCTDSERQENVFVSPDDERIGDLAAVDTATGSRPYRYTDSFFMARAPNTEYWWMACHQTDSDCRADARLWKRSLDRQLATIDPQARTTRNVARSY